MQSLDIKQKDQKHYQQKNSRDIFVFISYFLILLLPFEDLPFFTKAEVLPLTSLFALLFLPLIIVRKSRKTALFDTISFFFAYIVIYSLFMLLIDSNIYVNSYRFTAFLRQLSALTMGVSVFLVLRTTLRYLSDRQVARGVLFSFIPPFLISALNILWDFSKNETVRIASQKIYTKLCCWFTKIYSKFLG